MAHRSMEQFDVLVIGSGPAGEGAAMTAAKHHRSVALVERYYEVGGSCTHWGTIPSKALRHAAKILHDEIAGALSYHLREQGCVIRHNDRRSAAASASCRKRRCLTKPAIAHSRTWRARR